MATVVALNTLGFMAVQLSRRRVVEIDHVSAFSGERASQPYASNSPPDPAAPGDITVLEPEARMDADVIFPAERKRFRCPETTRYGRPQIGNRHVISSHVGKREKIAGSLARSRFHIPG